MLCLIRINRAHIDNRNQGLGGARFPHCIHNWSPLISPPFTPHIGAAPMHLVEIISNRRLYRNLVQFRFTTATFFARALNALAFLHSCKSEGYSQFTFCHSRLGSESLVGAPRRPPRYFTRRPHQPGCFGSPLILGVTPLWYMKAPTITSRRSEASMFPNSRPPTARDRLIESQ